VKVAKRKLKVSREMMAQLMSGKGAFPWNDFMGTYDAANEDYYRGSGMVAGKREEDDDDAVMQSALQVEEEEKAEDVGPFQR